MFSQLHRVQDWEALAQTDCYSAKTLALRSGVSLRQLERFFLAKFGKSPHAWLHELRMRRALELLKEGASAKGTAYTLRYKDPGHFTNDFKSYYGITPRNVILSGVNLVDQTKKTTCRDSTSNVAL